MKTVLLFLAIHIGIVGASTACRFPPSLWCESEEIATHCKVYDQCKESVWTEHAQAPPVSLELYFENQCPGCQDFVNQQLFPTYKSIGSIMNVTLVPYGNAHEKKVGGKWEFECQHGKVECIGNMLETCSIHVLKDMQKIIPFIKCMESSDSPLSAVKSCAEQLKAPLDQIMSCYNSSLGNTLEHEMALRTEALRPRHHYVPWIVLNGIHTEKINNLATIELKRLICRTYTGPKPTACKHTEKRTYSSRSDVF